MLNSVISRKIKICHIDLFLALIFVSYIPEEMICCLINNTVKKDFEYIFVYRVHCFNFNRNSINKSLERLVASSDCKINKHVFFFKGNLSGLQFIFNSLTDKQFFCLTYSSCLSWVLSRTHNLKGLKHTEWLGASRQ